MKTFCGVGRGLTPSSQSIYWKDIIKIGSSFSKDLMKALCKFDLGNGFHIPFWKAIWLEELSLGEEFLGHYALSCLKKVSVAGMG